MKRIIFHKNKSLQRIIIMAPGLSATDRNNYFGFDTNHLWTMVNHCTLKINAEQRHCINSHETATLQI
jgi:hypothetical protein